MFKTKIRTLKNESQDVSWPRLKSRKPQLWIFPHTKQLKPNILWNHLDAVMLNEAKTSRPRPKPRGRGQSLEAEAEAKASRPRPKFWPQGHFGPEDLTSLSRWYRTAKMVCCWLHLYYWHLYYCSVYVIQCPSRWIFSKIQDSRQIKNTENTKLSTTQKSQQQKKTQQNKTTLVQSPFTTLGQKTTLAYSTILPSKHGAYNITSIRLKTHWWLKWFFFQSKKCNTIK